MDDDLDVLWARWHANPSSRNEAAVVRAAQPVVRMAVRSLRFGPEHDEDDLLAMGQFGLLDALRGGVYDPQKGKFGPFVGDCVKRHVRNEVRDVVGPRVKRWSQQRLTELSRAETDLEVQLHRPPTDEEVAGRLGVTVERVGHLRRRALASRMAASLTPEMEGERAPDVDETMEAGAGLDFEQMRLLLGPALEELEGADRIVIALYYVYGKTMPQIARETGIAVSMVSKIRDRAVRRVVQQIVG